MYGACTYDGHGARRECGPISWIAPRDRSGFGPPGSLVVAGSMAGAPAGAPVFLHWRNATRGSPWTTEPYAPMPDARGTWFNFIPGSDPGQRYQVFTTSPLTASEPCTYAGDGARTLCP